jgi:hypothetical protein
MKMFISTSFAALTLVGRTVLAAELPIMASGAAVDCVPGMVAAAPDVCSLPGFHWEQTTVYVGHHADARQVWMLLPNK